MKKKNKIKVKGKKMKDKLKLLGISFVNVVIKNNNFNKFFDALKEHDFVMAEDYKIVLQAQVDYLVRNDPVIKNSEVPLFTIPVNLEEKTFIVNMDEESFESLDDSYNSLSLEVESFIELLGL